MFSLHFSFLILGLLSFAQNTLGLSLLGLRSVQQRRAQNVQQTVRIPLQINDLQQYSMTVAMSPGPNAQNLSFSISTATGYTMVAGTGCSSCGVQSYDQSSSASVQNTTNSQEVALWSSPTSGHVVKEDCALTRADGSPWSYANQSIVVATQSQTIVPSYGHSGVLGLGTNGRDGKFNETFMGNWLSQHPDQQNFTYGLALNGPQSTSSSSNNGGEIHLLAPDTEAFSGDVSWKEMTPFTSNATDADFFIDLDSWSFQTEGEGQIRQSGLEAIVDPFLAPLRFPSSQARAIFSTVNGAQSHVNPNTSATNVWDLPCDTKMTLSFTFNGFVVSLDESVLVRRATDHCISTIEEWADSSVRQYALGSTFISAVYMIFSVSGPSQGSVGFAPRATQLSSTVSAAAIAGIVIGSLALIVAAGVGIALFCCWRRRRTQAAVPYKSENIPSTTPYVYTVEPRYESEAVSLMAVTPSTAGFQRPTSTQYFGPSTTSGTTDYSESSFGLDSPPPYAGASSNRVGAPLAGPVVAVGPPPTRDRKGQRASAS